MSLGWQGARESARTERGRPGLGSWPASKALELSAWELVEEAGLSHLFLIPCPGKIGGVGPGTSAL